MRILLLLLLLASSNALATGVYQKPADFIADSFAGEAPAPTLLWLSKDLMAGAHAILGHDYNALRLRYWHAQERSAWILEEIGKDRPITVGLVVHSDRLERVKVLAFRESRGWEVRRDAFTDQFRSAALTTDNNLDRPIDGITGATLSVRALTKLARLALYLHQNSEAARVKP